MAVNRPSLKTLASVKAGSFRARDTPSNMESPLCASGTCSMTSVSSVIPHRPDSYSSNSEALELLKDRIKKRHLEITKAFRMFRLREDSSWILQSHFRSVLDTFCFRLSEGQFRTVLRRCNRTPEGAIDYHEFLTGFAELPRNKLEQAFKCDIEANGRMWTLEEVEKKLRDQILHKMKMVCLAFRLFDHNQDGKVQRLELKKIIENFCEMKISEELYRRFWSRYDPTDTGVIDYQEFLKKLALNVSLYQKCVPNLNMKIALTWPDVDIEQYNSHKRRLAILTRTDDPSLRGLTLEQIETRIRDKIIKDYALLKRAFLVLDPDGTGFVPYDGFQSTLVHFTHPMSAQLFSQLMQRLGVQSTDRVSWRSFLDQVRGLDQRPRPQRFEVVERRASSRKSAASAILCRIVPKLRQLQIQPGMGLGRAFNIKGQASGDDAFITRQELRLMIERKGSHLSENDMKELMVALDPGHTNLIAYSKFCSLFGEPRTKEEDEKAGQDNEVQKRTERLAYHPKNTRLQPILWEKLVGKLKSKIHKNYETVEKALGACDFEQKGWIGREQLRQVLHKFCFRLTEDEFERLLQMVDAVDGVVSIRRFLDIFRETEREHLQKWSAMVNQLAKPTSPHPWSEQQLDALLEEILLNNWENLLDDFQQLDFLGRETVSKTDFSTVLYKHIGRLSQSEVETLWRKLPIDKHGNVEYVKLVEAGKRRAEVQQSLEERQKTPRSQTTTSTISGRLSTNASNTNDEQGFHPGSPSEVPSVRGSSPQKMWSSETRRVSNTNRTMPADPDKNVDRDTRPVSSYIPKVPKLELRLSSIRPATGIVGVAKADFKMHKVLARRWREIKNECCALDQNNSGLISSDNFLAILAKYGVPVSSGPLLQLLQTKYNLRLDSPVSYINFLKDFFLAIGRKDGDYRFKRQPPKKAFSAETTQLYNILLDLRNPILSRWRSLKKAFRRNDLLGTGSIEVFRFRATLKDHDIIIPDGDFHELASYLDPDMKGTIRYNDFLGIFMKSIN